MIYPVTSSLRITTVTWSSNLANANSAEFKAAETTVCNAIRTATASSFTYQIGCKVNSFSQSTATGRKRRSTGVDANYTVNIKSGSTTTTPADLFKNAMTSTAAAASLTASGATQTGTYTQGTPTTVTGTCQVIGGVSMCASAERISSLAALILVGLRYL